MLRRIAVAAAICLGAGAMGMGALVPAANAGTAPKATFGTYQFSVQGESPFPEVLQRDHTVGTGDTGSWSVLKHVVTVQLEGGPAGPIICSHNGQPPDCLASSTYVGPKTATGIASPSAEGTATEYIGTSAVTSQPFYAVRVGAVRIRPVSTTCTVFNGDSSPGSGQADCAYGTGIVSNAGFAIQWSNGQTSTLSETGWTRATVSDRRCPTIVGDTLSTAMRDIGGTVASGPLAGSQFRGTLCEYVVNPSRGVPPGTGYFQNEGLVHL